MAFPALPVKVDIQFYNFIQILNNAVQISIPIRMY